MRSPQRLVWTEGMLMSPQHLQQLDDYHEARVERRVAALGPYHWGISALDIDPAALAAGQLQIQRFAGVFPDGLVLEFERGDPHAPAARPLDATLGTSRALEVFLGVPRVRQGIDSYATGEVVTATQSRFSVVSRPVSDALAAASQVPVAYAQPNVRLIFGGEPRDDYEVLPIAEITRDALGAPRLEAAYVPPVLRVDASPFVIEGLRRVVRSMVGKQRDLADSRRHRDEATVEFTANDVTRYLQLCALNGCIPVLNHVAEAGSAHPHLVYLALLQAAGQLSTFAPEGDPLALPPFQYTGLRATFEPILQRLESLLRGVAAEQSIAVPLEHRPGGLHVGRFDDERLVKCTQFVLAVRSDVPETQVSDQLPRLSKVASPKDMQRIVKAAAPGVRLQHTFRPPSQIPVRAGQVYFTLATDDAYWQSILAEKMVVLFIPQPFDTSQTTLELMAVPPEVARAR